MTRGQVLKDGALNSSVGMGNRVLGFLEFIGLVAGR